MRFSHYACEKWWCMSFLIRKKTNPSWVFDLIPKRFLQETSVNLRNHRFSRLPVWPPKKGPLKTQVVMQPNFSGVPPVAGPLWFSDVSEQLQLGELVEELWHKNQVIPCHIQPPEIFQQEHMALKSASKRGFRRLCRHVKNFEVLSHPLFF